MDCFERKRTDCSDRRRTIHYARRMTVWSMSLAMLAMQWDTEHEEKCSKVETLMPLGNILGCWRGGNVEIFSAGGQGFAKMLPRQRQVYNVPHQASLMPPELEKTRDRF